MKSARKRSLTAAALVLLPLAGGCDWRKLDEAVENAPVLSLGAPANYTQEDVGRLLLPLPPAPGVAGRFMFFSTVQPNAALVQLDEAGKSTTFNAPDAALMPLGSRPVRSAHFVPGLNKVFLGVPDYRPADSAGVPVYTGAVYQMPLEAAGTFNVAPFAVSRTDVPQDLLFGMAVASGNMGLGSPMFDDLLVLSARYLHIFPDGLATTRVASGDQTCNLDVGDTTDGRLGINRALAVADLLPGGTQEAIVGVPRAAPQQTAGKVVILTTLSDNPLVPVPCPLQIPAPASPTPYLGAANFGNTLVVGDVSGPAGVPDGAPDLVVGAPPDRVFVYLGPLDPLAAIAPQVIMAPPPGVTGSFGARLLAMDYDGQPGDELVVSLPDATVAGANFAGQVLVYKIGAPGAEAGLLANIQKLSVDAEFELGIGLGALPFAAPGCGKAANLLLAGGIDAVLTYFRAPGSWPDPRCLPTPGM